MGWIKRFVLVFDDEFYFDEIEPHLSGKLKKLFGLRATVDMLGTQQIIWPTSLKYRKRDFHLTNSEYNKILKLIGRIPSNKNYKFIAIGYDGEVWTQYGSMDENNFGINLTLTYNDFVEIAENILSQAQLDEKNIEIFPGDVEVVVSALGVETAWTNFRRYAEMLDLKFTDHGWQQDPDTYKLVRKVTLHHPHTNLKTKTRTIYGTKPITTDYSVWAPFEAHPELYLRAMQVIEELRGQDTVVLNQIIDNCPDLAVLEGSEAALFKLFMMRLLTFAKVYPRKFYSTYEIAQHRFAIFRSNKAWPTLRTPEGQTLLDCTRARMHYFDPTQLLIC